MEQEKIYHHHTPRFYLLPWADANERIWWLGYGKMRRSGLTVVGGENDFYRLRHLTEQDIFRLQQFIESLPEDGRKGHHELLNSFALPPALKLHLQRTGFDDPEANRTVDFAIANMDENYHTAIENGFKRYLDSMIAGDASFYDDDEATIEFLHALSVQILRTKGVRERIMKRSTSSPFEDADRVWPIISHIAAVTMGGSFYVDRKDFKIVLVENHTEVPFITSRGKDARRNPGRDESRKHRHRNSRSRGTDNARKPPTC